MAENFFGEKSMIRSWTHTNLSILPAAAFRDVRTGTGRTARMCLRLETMNYQPKPNGLDRSQSKD